MPRRAPELLNGSARRGAAGMRRVDEGAGTPFGNPVQMRGAQETSGVRVAFSLDTFFWPNKRKYRGRRSANRH
ncbi:MAG: hypothetical protein BVN35_18165 [Proteobacteria bacterium ST_bin11]|nr:MAG: hypothetical protein BVN35_18165 [Proteobacteria bacterium ST_bin11]